jgi:hypothetical protein
MGIFDLFKKRSDPEPEDGLKLLGPKYLRDYLTIASPDMADLVRISHPNIQWLGQLQTSSGNGDFKIKYFGDLLSGVTVIDKNEKPFSVVAVDPMTKEEIVVFDKQLHGWDGFICNTREFDDDPGRKPDNWYKTRDGQDTFHILFLAYYNQSTRDELHDMAGPDGKIENGREQIIPLQDAFDDAFDALVIYAIDAKGKKYDIVNEELA